MQNRIKEAKEIVKRYGLNSRELHKFFSNMDFATANYIRRILETQK